MVDATGSKKGSSIFRKVCLTGVTAAAAAVVVVAATAWGYGAGRVRSTGYSIKQCFNPSKIYKLYKARQFEKRLAGEIYGRSSFGDYGYGRDPDEFDRHQIARGRIFGEDGLAEFNDKAGTQAEEYVLAIKKITGKYVKISQKDISNPHGRDVMYRFVANARLEDLEEAALNWNSNKRE